MYRDFIFLTDPSLSADLTDERLQSALSQIKSSKGYVPRYENSILAENAMELSMSYNAASQGGTHTYSELASQGIEAEWSGRYWIGGRWVEVEATAEDWSDVENKGNQKVVNVEVNNEPGRAHTTAKYVAGPFGSILYDSWSKSKPGNVIMYTQDRAASSPIGDTYFKGIVAHEFGHIFGLGDAYENKGFLGFDYRPPAVPGKVHPEDKMNVSRTGTVSVVDISMLLEAQSRNKPQYFPLK